MADRPIPTRLENPGPERAPTEAASRPRMPGWASALLYLVLFLVVATAAQLVLLLPLIGARELIGIPGSPSGLLDPSGLPVPLWAFLLGVFTWGSLAVILAYTGVMTRLVERASLADLGLRVSPGLLRHLGVGLGLALLLFLSVVGVGAARNGYRVEAAVTSPVQALTILLTSFLLLLPYAAMEEIVFRGYLLRAAGRSWGLVGGVLFSTAAFAVIHSSNPYFADYPLALLGLALSGLYLAAAYLLTENLWLPIFLHTGWNLFEGPVFGLPVSGLAMPVSIFRTEIGRPAYWTGGEFGPEAGLLLCLMVTLHLAVFWSQRRAVRRLLGLPPHDPAWRTRSSTASP